MDNIANAFLALAATAHEWADDLAGEAGRDYDAYRALVGDDNRYFRAALEEMQWQGRAPSVDVASDYVIEF